MFIVCACRDGSSCDCIYPYIDGARCSQANWCLEDTDGNEVDCFRGTCQSHETGWLPPDTDVTGSELRIRLVHTKY